MEVTKKRIDIKRGVALWDLHYPDVDWKSFKIACDFTVDFKPDFFILGGDQLDLNCISYYNHDKPLLVEGQRLKKEYKGFQERVLNTFNKILGEDCKRYWFIGNHEYRAQRVCESDPQWQGMIEPENHLDLSKYTTIDFNEVLTLGHMNFIHGIYYNKYSAFKHLSEYEGNIFYGHTHSSQVHTKTSQVKHLPKQGVNIGCLCNKNPFYKRNRPNDWIHQFMFFYLMGDGSFHYYVPTIIQGHCVINDRVYRV
jgi:hypothetical protein